VRATLAFAARAEGAGRPGHADSGSKTGAGASPGDGPRPAAVLPPVTAPCELPALLPLRPLPPYHGARATAAP